ncbi:MAG: ArsA family ATPase, partial [Candidatus Nanohaloarchaea archaeon]
MQEERMLTADRSDAPTKFLWFSGKGGTGKTTVSAATALQLADRGHDTLVVSTDPANSLSDSLDRDIDDLEHISDNLDALEIDPEEEAEDYRQQLQAAEVEEGTLQAELSESMDIMKSGPGVAEMAAFNRFMEFMDDDEYDVIVFDTAPTGHTLKLLQLPEVMDSMVGKVLRMRMRFSQAVDTVTSLFGKESDVDSGVRKLEEMKDRIENARAVMADPDRTRFNFVLIPETMAVYETERAVERVQEFDIPTGRLFVNKIVPENPDCEFCTARRTMQEDNLADIHDRFHEFSIVETPLLRTEVRGPEMLQEFARR